MEDGQSIAIGDVKSKGSKKPGMIDALMDYIVRADNLIERYTFLGKHFIWLLYQLRVFIFLFLILSINVCMHIAFCAVLSTHTHTCYLCSVEFLYKYLVMLLISSHPHILFRVLNFMTALWQGAAQYLHILEFLRCSEKFWKCLSNAILKVAGSSSSTLSVNLTEKDARNLADSYLCQSAILGIMSYELFLQKKLLHADSLLKDAAGSQGKEQDNARTEKSKAPAFCDVKEIWSSWCKDSVLEKLMKSYTSGYNDDIYTSAKVSFTQFSSWF